MTLAPSFPAATLDEMHRFAVALGQAARAGDVLALVGPLGAGKTTFTQGLALGLKIPPERHVSSPTFALVNEHQGRLLLVHADLYRLRDTAELAELGLEEAFDHAVTAIEWADRFPECLPKDHLRLEILPRSDGGRVLAPRATGPRSEAWARAFLL